MQHIYVHLPFCQTRCHYCDFYSIAQDRTRAGDPEKLAVALQTEINLYKEQIDPVLKTLFLGGGTPSLWTHQGLESLFEGLKSVTSLADAEITIECNPESLVADVSKLTLLKNLGVNRISLGVQSMEDSLLKLLGRNHDSRTVLRALDLIFHAGFENVSVDVMCGIPQQEMAHLEKTVQTFLDFPLTHMSGYILTLAAHHPMFTKLPGEQVQQAHYERLHELLTSADFEHYEVSNFAKKGFRCRHNMAYWTHQSYLGLGPSAHSYSHPSFVRWKNKSSLHKYTADLASHTLPVDEAHTEQLTAYQADLERWMLNLRLADGFAVPDLNPFQQSLVRDLQGQGLLLAHPEKEGFVKPSSQGFLVMDSLVLKFLAS
jgi:oxygen-independent coproporphyrinogen-3 oxidase